MGYGLAAVNGEVFCDTDKKRRIVCILKTSG